MSATLESGAWWDLVGAICRQPRAATRGAIHEVRTPRVPLLTAYPEIEAAQVSMGPVRFVSNNLDPGEQFVLSALAHIRRPARIFEIGTFDGASTLIMARHAPEAEILTLDLPPEGAGSATVAEEVANAQAGVGSRFHGTPEAQRITQLFGDSRTFDFSRWVGTVDLVLVDGGHEYDVARSDTLNALKLRSENGIVVWDDYCRYWPGVMRAVDELVPRAFRFTQIAPEFAVFDPGRGVSGAAPGIADALTQSADARS